MGTFEEFGLRTPIQSEQDLIGRIIADSTRISETPGVLDRVWQSLHFISRSLPNNEFVSNIFQI